MVKVEVLIRYVVKGHVTVEGATWKEIDEEALRKASVILRAHIQSDQVDLESKVEIFDTVGYTPVKE